MLKTLFAGAIGVGSVSLMLLFPVVNLAIVVVNFFVHLPVLGLQLVLARMPRNGPRARQPLENEPFVSIQVPTHNEPPEIVLQTLEALANLKWSQYEVLVIDNNTSDPALWEPLAEFCQRNGPRFRFVHVENLKGFKAGALNYIRPMVDPRAEFIFVVDADYVVDRKCLRRAFCFYTDPNIGLIQFPQDYRNVTRHNLGVALDFKHFFSGFMTVANAMNCVPSTGTLSLINIKALQAVDGFATTVITEDADLGLRMSLRGFRSIFVNEVIGRGLMPHDLESLKKQRWRWAFGNTQILKGNFKKIFFGTELGIVQKLGYLSHLTAWLNFNLIPSLSLILLGFVAWFSFLDIPQIYTVVLSGFTLVTYLVMKYGIIHYSLKQDGHNLREIWQAYFTHLGLGWIFSASWLRCLFDGRSPFVRTNKFLSTVVPGTARYIVIELALGTGLLMAAAALLAADFVIGPIAAALMASARFGILWVRRQTDSTLERTTEIFSQSDREDAPRACSQSS